MPTSERIDQRLIVAAIRDGILRHGYVEILKRHGMVPSMSCYDNAVAESFFSSLKNGLVHHCSFKTRDEARTATFECIEVF